MSNSLPTRSLADGEHVGSIPEGPKESCEYSNTRRALWMSMFQIRVSSYVSAERYPEHQRWQEAAARIAEQFLRERPTLPANPKHLDISLTEAEVRGELPIAHCACRGRKSLLYTAGLPQDHGQHWNSRVTEVLFRESAEHPCDELLRRHALRGAVPDSASCCGAV